MLERVLDSDEEAVIVDSAMEQLARLQQLDEEIRQLTASIAALPRHLEQIRAKLTAAQQRVAAGESRLREEETLRRRCESDLKDQQQKIDKFRSQTNSVKNNEQFHALQHEIAFAQAEIGRIEDRELESMERADGVEKDLTQARQELASAAAYMEAEQVSAERATALQEASLAKWRAERAALRPNIEEALLDQYDRVARSRGTGLARASDQRCTGCQMGLRPQLWNQLRDGARLTCESCGRLLYFSQKLQIETGGAPAAQRA
jgi:uncharacterized protein